MNASSAGCEPGIDSRIGRKRLRVPRSRRLARIVFAAALVALPAVAQVEVTYLGNEGVLLESAEASVLIDALHAPYKGYATAPPELRETLSRGEAPYDADLVLVSHVHGDHFDAAMTASHLERNGNARLVTSAQAAGKVLEAMRLASPARKRIDAATLAPGQTRSVKAPGVTVTLLALPHGGRAWGEIENLGHLIEMGGVTILHVGDADVDPRLFARFRLAETGIDLALLPDWYLAYGEGQRLVREQIRPRRLAAVHVMPGSEREVAPRIRAAFPDAPLLTTIGARLTIAP